MSSLIANELLCYVQNNFSKHPRSLLGVAINGFYNDDEVYAAKVCLHEIIEGLNVDGMPRFIRRQAGDNKRKLECEDILTLYTVADNAKCQLPTFVAVNLQRVPTVSPGDVDIYVMAANLSTLSSHVEMLTKKVNELTDSCDVTSKLQKVSERLNVCEAFNKEWPVLPVVQSSGIKVLPEQMRGSTSMVQHEMVELPKQPKRVPVIRIKGSASQTSVKAVPRDPPPKLLKAFVGRLDIETTEDDLKAFLNAAHLNVVHCRKLKPPNGKTFKTSAFYVACSDDCEEIFYKDETWPEGAELRDWYTAS